MKKLLLLVTLLACMQVGFSQDKNFWTSVDESSVGRNLFINRFKPAAFKIFNLNELSFVNDARNVPSERSVTVSQSSFIISVPNADGQIERYKVVEAPVMAPELSAKYPGIKSYAGQGIEDPSSNIRFDMSPRGFHAMITSAKRPTIYIDPLERSSAFYVVFSRKDAMDFQKHFNCGTDVNSNAADNINIPEAGRLGADDGKLRSYRLALACTGEYAQYFLNGSETTDTERKAKVLAGMNTLVTRTNQIYERDFGVRMVLVGNNDAIIYLNPATDPWTTEYNTKTQQTIDAVIGNANYDIGHLVHKEATAAGNNGNAGCIGCVCKTGSKGSAFTSHVTPEGDPFIVDYTTHEMGHQFGGNHTFTFRSESTTVQMEPGSGSTIMGYAGITGSTDVQPHSDDYFHAKSIEQVTNYIKGTTGGACAVVTITGNTTPTVSAGADYTIPKSTPFAITGTASDVDVSDVLQYDWEQIDNLTTLGSATVPSATSTKGPQFRSYNYTTSPSRTVPELSYVLSGANGFKWEVLPSVARSLNFRLTVRDNSSGGGNNNTDDMLITVATSGPFAVTAPNTSVTWNAGTSQTITWSVNSTNLAPVSCANVMISLSTDGGQTFPTVLLASTANDGTEIITVPSTPSATCRIKIEAVANIFFDISNTNFTISGTAPACGNPVGLTSSAITNTGATVSWSAVTNAISYDVDYKLSSNSTWTNVATATTSTSANISGLTQGSTHDWRVRANCSAASSGYSASQFTTTSPATCGNVTGLASSSITSTSATVSWSSLSGALNYDVDYKANSSATWINVATATTATSANLSGLTASTLYDWRVRANCNGATGIYTTAQFTTTAIQTGCQSNYDVSANGTIGGAATIPFNTNITGLINPTGDLDNYKFVVTTGGTITLTLQTLPADYDLKLLNSAGSQLAVSQRNNTSNETISYTASAGTYYARVYGYKGANNATACYTLKVQLGTASKSGEGEELITKTSIAVYPNPAINILNIKIPGQVSKDAQLFITDAKGITVKVQSVRSNVQQVNIVNLARGIYMIKLNNGGIISTNKFVKQ